jgi:hypothetical protein
MTARYKVNLLSKSDPQIAEAVMKAEIERRTGKRIERPGEQMGTIFKYQIPAWMTFRELDILDAIRAADFRVADTGGVLMPKELADKKIAIGKGVYRMGIGGLHSSESCQAVSADTEHVLIDLDVTSYYPAILLNQGLYPKHIGPEFLTVYRQLVEDRLAAKKAGDKTVAESLKICVNGLFGKLGSKWSIVYAPELMIQITLTGQLAVLMLIEALEGPGVQVVSGNTDGIAVRLRRGKRDWAQARVKEWEETTGFSLEQAEYDSLYSRDVNNYIAVKTDRTVKLKGVYGKGLALQKNPVAEICAMAVVDYLTLGADIPTRIRACRDLKKFLTLRQVKGGATFRGKEIGRAIRWYYSLDVEEALLYKCNGYLVPKTYGAQPCMDLPAEFPEDLDYDWYINEARGMLAEAGGV